MGKSSRELQTSPEQHVQRSCGGREQDESEEKEEASVSGCKELVCVCVCEMRLGLRMLVFSFVADRCA